VPENTTDSYAERLGVPRKRRPTDQYMVVTEIEVDSAQMSALLKDKLDKDIAPEVIDRLAYEDKIGHRQACTFTGERVGKPRYTLADAANLAALMDLDPHLTDPAPVANDRLTESRPATAGYRSKPGSFAYDSPADRDEQDAYPNAVPNSHLARFTAEMCTTAPFPKSGAAARVRAARLYEALTEWWNTEELPAGELPTRNAFGRHLTRSAFPLSQEWDNRLRESANYRLGIRLKLKAELAAGDDLQAASEPASDQSAAGATVRKRPAPAKAGAEELPAGEVTAPTRRAAK
jgi:hypothetical protein